jgi:hypothetical protein
VVGVRAPPNILHNADSEVVPIVWRDNLKWVVVCDRFACEAGNAVSIEDFVRVPVYANPTVSIRYDIWQLDITVVLRAAARDANVFGQEEAFRRQLLMVTQFRCGKELGYNTALRIMKLIAVQAPTNMTMMNLLFIAFAASSSR